MNNELTGDYRKFMDKDYLGAWDIPDGGDLVATIDHVEINEVKNERGSENKMTVHFMGGLKPLIVNATNGEAISTALKTKKVELWKGKKIALYKESGKWFGKVGEAVRVRSEAPSEVVITCEECGGQIIAANGMNAAEVAEYTKNNYGKRLCAKCARKAKSERDGAEQQ